MTEEGRRVAYFLYRIAVCATFATTGSPLMTPKTRAFKNWQLGVLPDTMQTFDAALAAIGLGAGLAISLYRFLLFYERETRLLDFIIVLLQVC